MELKYKGQEYKLVLNINVMEAIQDEVGSFSEWCEEVGKSEPNLNYLLIGYTAMVNEWADMENEEKDTNIPMLTKKQVGRMITNYSIGKLARTVRTKLVENVSGNESKNE